MIIPHTANTNTAQETVAAITTPKKGIIPKIPSPAGLRPPLLYDLMNSIVNFDKETETSIHNLAKESRTKIFDFTYPLSEKVDNKVEKVFYTIHNDDGTTTKVEGTLLTPEEKEKLSALSIDEDGSVGISGTVSASNVQELYNTVVNIVTGHGTDSYDGV